MDESDTVAKRAGHAEVSFDYEIARLVDIST
jgi:hypothetical protein